MSTKTDSLKSIFIEVAGEETITEHQEQGPSHDPLDENDINRERELANLTKHTGLDDAVSGTELS